jgi:hypothetical protein
MLLAINIYHKGAERTYIDRQKEEYKNHDYFFHHWLFKYILSHFNKLEDIRVCMHAQPSPQNAIKPCHSISTHQT